MAGTNSNPNVEPGLTPPPGVTPNFVDPPSQGNITIIVMTIYLVLTTPMVAIRMYTRCFIKGPVKWDDWTMLLGWIGLVGLAAEAFLGLTYGAGIDQWNVPLAHVKAYGKLWDDIEIVARVSILFVKLSILLLFLRIFNPPGTPKNKLYWWTVGTAWFNVLYAIALVLVVLLQCAGKSGPQSECINDFLLLVLSSVINVISDIVMLVIPIGAIWRLHMRSRQKWGMSVIFAVGLVAVGSSIARLGWQVAVANSDNSTIILNDVTLMAVAEQVAGIIVGCMPIMPAFFRHVLGQSQTPASHDSSQKNRKLRYAMFSIGGGSGNSRRKGASKDPYNITTALNTNTYQELDDIEAGKASQAKNGTSVTITGNPFDSSLDSVREVGEVPDNTVLTSRSFQVESHPRGPADILPASQTIYGRAQ